MTIILIIISLVFGFFVEPVFAVDYSSLDPTNNDPIYVQAGTPLNTVSLEPIISDSPVFQDSVENRQASSLKKGIEAVYEIKEDIAIELFNLNDNQIETVLINDQDKKIEAQISQVDKQGITTLTISPPQQLKPGKYTLEIIDQTGSKIKQDFLWGVLAINPNKSIYNSGETADLAMSVLNEAGEMDCDAKLTLKITDPGGELTELSTQNGKIIVNQAECNSSVFTLKPDYQSSFKTSKFGKYLMELIGETINGVYTVNDSFEVQSDINFETERVSATRIYPLNNYPVIINIKANQNFKGHIYDEVPVNFDIFQPEKGQIKYTVSQTNYNTKKIDWLVDLQKGESISLKYQYKAPNISPQFYLIGPLQLKTDNNLIYQESRSWQIAADAVSVTFINAGTTAWVAPDNVYSVQVQAWGGGGGGGDGQNGYGGGGGGGGAFVAGTMAVIPGNTYPIVVGSGGIGGTGSAVGKSGVNTTFNSTTFIAKGGLGGNGTVGAAGGLGGQASQSVGTTKFDGGKGGIGNNTTSDAGGGGGGAAGPLGIGRSGFNANTSVGGSGGAGNFGSGGKGGASGNNGAGGIGTSNATGGGGGGGGDNGSNGGKGGAPGGGGGGGEVNLATSMGANGQVVLTYTANLPPNTPTNTTPSNGAIDISLNPTLIASSYSDTEGDFHLASQWQIATNSNFSSIVWDTGTTTATTTINVGYTLSNSTIYYWRVRYQAIQGNWSSYSNSDVGTSFTTMAEPQIPPYIPILSLPTNGTSNVSLTPTFKTVTTDLNNENLQYELKICTDSNMTANCQTFDQTSSNIGWSSQNVGTSAYSSGTTATYVLQLSNSLIENTTYFWKTRAKDYTGSNTWSSTQVTPNSFVTRSLALDLTQATFRWSADDVSGESRAGVGDTWYDINYDYRAPFTVTNNVGTTLNDYQVRLSINTSTLVSNSKMRSDCNDLRITDNDKITSLSYWIESGCNTTNTVIWVKVPYLAASTSRNIYFYYGNNSASIGSDGDNTFDFFDDFSGTSLNTSKWTEWNPNSWGNLNISGGTLALSGTNSGSTQIGHGFISANPFSFSNHRVEYSARWNFLEEPSNLQTLIMRIGSTNPTSVTSGPVYKFYFFTSADWWDSYYGYHANSFNSGTESVLYDEWEYHDGTHNVPTSFKTEQFNWYSSNYLSTKESENGGSTWITHGSSSYNNNVVNMSIPQAFGAQIESISGVGESMVAWLDWYRIRKFAATEPTGSLGTETTMPSGGSSGATWLAAENVGITNVSPNSNIRVRFSVGSTGDSDTLNFRLQVAPLGASAGCTGVPSANFSDVSTTAGSAVAVMTTSPNFTNQESTTNQLTDSGVTFVPGKMVEYNSNQSDDITLAPTEFTEVEYNFQITANAGSTTPYCFRVVNIDSPLNTYTQIAELTTTLATNNEAPSAPFLPYINNTTAQAGQQTPVYGLIDHTPAFSAVFDDPNTSDTSSYYQIQIGSDSDWATAEIWDSTKSSIGSTCNENSRCADVVYGGGTSLVDGSTYYWRIKFWDSSDAESPWSDPQQFSMNNIPIVSNVVLNGNNSINLNENSNVGVSWISTVTDADGYSNLSSVTGKIYRSSVGSSCAANNNNCYVDVSCDFYNCSGNSCSTLCSVDPYFFAEATDTDSTFADQYWQAWTQATDIRNEIGSTISTSTLTDINTLVGFNIGSSLVYGEVFAGSDTGSSNTVTTITNTGNSLINLEITGDYMCTDYPSCGSQNIEPYYQQYNLNTFTYGTGTTLSTSPKVVNIGISKPTQTPSNSFKNLYWGIGIPNSTEPGNYQGATTILVY